MTQAPPCPPPWPKLLQQLLRGDHLRSDQATALMQGWLEGQIEPVLTGGLLVALQANGVDGEELAAMAQVLRQACALPSQRPAIHLVDTCGTGGDGADSFNISTAVACVAAACGAAVAKHGNRSASGKVGSADVLEALGLHLQAPQERVVAALSDVGLTFLFAPGWHPALVALAPLRRSLGIRTVFNLLGPLVNPLQPDSQVVGVARVELLDPMAEALARLGLARAVVVHGPGGLDEASLAGPNDLRLVTAGSVRSELLDPQALGLDVVAPLRGVGENLQDHLETYVQFACTKPITLYSAMNPLVKLKIGIEWLLFGSGLGATNHFESGGFIRSEAGVKQPDLQYHFLPMAVRYDGNSPASCHGFQAH
ncbi:MAG: anthranilate phosphoribosyltransferase, partial [Synechococcaceae bacterium WB9_2_170]|nr:anthranilate phosphoribosyltransferase [Synechococcaceae bacterium WB9_2_170]